MSLREANIREAANEVDDSCCQLDGKAKSTFRYLGGAHKGKKVVQYMVPSGDPVNTMCREAEETPRPCIQWYLL